MFFYCTNMEKITNNFAVSSCFCIKKSNFNTIHRNTSMIFLLDYTKNILYTFPIK